MNIFKAPSLATIKGKYPLASNFKIHEVTTHSTSNLNSFYGRTHLFEKNLKADEHLLMDISYKRIRLDLLDIGGNAIDMSDNIAFSLNAPATLYDRMNVDVDDKKFDRIRTDYSIIDTMSKRLHRRAERVDKEQFFEADFCDRQLQTVANPNVNKTVASKLKYNVFDLIPTFVLTTGTVETVANAGTSNSSFIIRDALAGNLLNSLLIKYLKIGSEIYFSSASGVAGGVVVDLTTTVITIIGNAILAEAVCTDMIIITDPRKSFYRKVPDTNGRYDLFIYPELSFWRQKEAWNSGKCKISFRFTTKNESDIAKHLVESIVGSKTLAADFQIIIQDIRLFLYTVNLGTESSLINKVRNFDRTIKEVRIEPVKKGQNDVSISVGGNLKSVIVAFAQNYQDTRTALNKFEIDTYTANVLSDIYTHEVYNYIEEFQMKLNEEFPEDRYKFTGDANEDSISRLYQENNYHMGMKNQFNETYDEFIKRGIFFYIPITDTTPEKKNLKFKWKFKAGLTATDFNMYIFTNHIDTKQVVVENYGITSITNLKDNSDI